MRGLKIAGQIISKVIVVLLALLLVLNLYTIVMRQALDVKQPSVFGFSSAVVLSGSMEPAIHVDDMVIIHRQSSYELQDIVMYEGEHSMITHRIVGTEEGSYITRGDSNNIDDPAVPAEKVVGKVICIIPGAGKAIGFMQSSLGMCILVLLAVAILILPDLWKKKHGADDSVK